MTDEMEMVPGRPDSSTAWIDAGGAQGIQVGSHTVQHNHFGHAAPLIRSAYLDQVRRIAPTQLRNRDAELAELAAFCNGGSEYAVVWWHAPAWAGKTALFSWFVLHPPHGVRIVAFFVTARHYGQNDRSAFLDNVLEQLAELLGYRDLPAGLTDSTREAHLTAMLTAAAVAAREAGQRLVLLVDGLDEDRGVMVGSESYSIAAVLPRHPPADLSIVVSSRSDPPLPPDVPPDHPLRVRCLKRDLGPSTHAEVVRADAERELKRIMLAGGVERDVLGLVAAARTGLALRDLAELTGEDEWLVEDHLATVTGRTFTRADAAYVLAHDELQSTAARLLGPTRLDDHRRRLHEWADSYRSLGWPADTPTFIVRGYFRMLAEEGDTARMVRYAADAGRHLRMLDHTEGDAAALEEIMLAQDALLASTEVDLPAMCKLALLRADLLARNTSIPLTLPGLWAAVGNTARAEALVRSISTDGDRRAVALTLLAPAMAAAGHHTRAERLAGLIPARVFVDPDQPSRATAAVVREIARAGEHERATELAHSIIAPHWQSRAYCEVVGALVDGNGNLAEAQERALRIPMPYWRAQALAVLARAAARRAQDDLAQLLAGQAEAVADGLPLGDGAFANAFLAREIRSWDGPDQARRLALVAAGQALDVGIETLAAIFPLLAEVLERPLLRNLACQAEAALGTNRDWRRRSPDEPVGKIVGAMASVWYVAGDLDQAVEVATAEANPFERDGAVLRLVRTAAADDFGAARILANRMSDLAGQDRALGTIIANLPDDCGDEHVSELVHAIRDRAGHAAALSAWGLRVVKRGDLETAADLARRAEEIGRSIGDPSARVHLLTSLASALVTTGDAERARSAARLAIVTLRAVPERQPISSAAAALTDVATEAGDYETAAAATRLIEDPHTRARAQTQLAATLARRNERNLIVGLLDDAETAATTIPRPHGRVEALRAIMTVLWIIGADEQAEALADRIADNEPEQPRALPLFPTADEPSTKQRDRALAEAVAAVAAQDEERGETLIGLIADPFLRGQARTSMVLALARAGQHDHAFQLARSEGERFRRDQRLRQLTEVLAEHADIELADKVARSIEGDFDRSAALIALARKVEPARARALLLDPVRSGKLPEIVDFVAQVCPQAMDVITDHLLA